MARIPEGEVNRIKEEISLLRLVEAKGIKLKSHGQDKIGHCPFHEDKTPSFVVSPSKNLWNCLGACGTGGSVIDWVMKIEGVSFKHAVELLKNDHPFLVAVDSPIKKTTVPKLKAPVCEDTDDQAMLTQVIDYYHETLKQAPEAQAYLAKRGLDDSELINHFKLGYANRTLGLRLPQKNRKAGAEIRSQLERLGIYRDTGREHFNGSLVIPVINEQGLIQEVYGRKLLDNLRKGIPKHTYLPGPHEGVFNVIGLKNTEEIILCESLIDALTFWRWGFRHVTTSYGINGFTQELLQCLIAYKVKRVLIAYDRDDAGNQAAAEVAKQLNHSGIDCFRILFPKDMDANQYACQMTPAQKALALVIRKAEWIGSGNNPPQSTTASADVEIPGDLFSLVAKKPAKEEKPPIKIESTKSTEAPQEKIINQQATPLPTLPFTDAEVHRVDKDLFITLGDRIYRVRGLDKNTDYAQLKIQLLVKKDDAFHMDKLDLTSSKLRQVFINQASVELGVKDEVIKKDLGKVLLVLEEQQAKQQDTTLQKPTELAPEERKEALALLHDPDLLNRILVDFNQAGVVGEEINKLTGYLACVSRKLNRPLAVMIQSSSAAGKSSLMDSILALMPKEERVQYSAMTGQSLFYMGETNLKHKILAISEEEGASSAGYALKLLQSEGEVTIASTGKDEDTGNLVTKEYKVEGPVMLFLTTTAIDIDEELLNRCLVLAVNESRAQTEAIHQIQRQRRTLTGFHQQLEKDRITQLHQNAQRLLKPLKIINPYADQLTFLADKTRTRRDHEKYLTLIDSVTLLHQYQRETKTLSHNGKNIDYIEVSLKDIETANHLAHEILGRTLDELPPQTRKLLKEIQALVQQECQAQHVEQSHLRFSRKHLRQQIGWTYDQVRVHLDRLVKMEYVLVHKGGRGQSFEYELLYDGNPETPYAHMMGLLDVSALKQPKNTPTTASLGGKTSTLGG
ncbi:MAG: CHC2 zinc finger domain-containing protein [Pseudomonadales bacterium]